MKYVYELYILFSIVLYMYTPAIHMRDITGTTFVIARDMLCYLGLFVIQDFFVREMSLNTPFFDHRMYC